MATKVKFQIGDWVEVKAVLVRTTKDQRRFCVRKPIIVKKKEDAFIGRVCGAKYVREGRYIPGSHEDPPCIIIDKAVFAFEVRRGLLNKPVQVLEADMKKIVIVQGTALPLLWQDYSKAFRQQMREIAGEMPRGENGKFKPV